METNEWREKNIWTSKNKRRVMTSQGLVPWKLTRDFPVQGGSLQGGTCATGSQSGAGNSGDQVGTRNSGGHGGACSPGVQDGSAFVALTRGLWLATIARDL